MEYVYVLSGREDVGNNAWGYGCDELSVFGVYRDPETAKAAFKNKVLEVAENVADTNDEFAYTDANIFENVEPTEEAYGWNCFLHENGGVWDVFLPENDSFDYGFWFLPTVILRKYELK